MTQTVLSYFSGTVLIGAAGINPQHYTRLIGSTYNPNFSVALLLLGLSFLLADCLVSIRKSFFYKLMLQLSAVCIFTHAIILTGSRAGFVIMLILFITFLIRWKKWISLVFLILMLVNIPLIVDWMPRSEQLFESAELRKEIWKNSFNLWQEHSLFGTTPIGFYTEYSSLFHEHVPHAHNMILGVFTEYGALGGIALLFVIFINGYKVLYLYFSKTKNKVHLDVFLFSLPVILLTGAFDYVLFSPQVAFLAIILLACWDLYTAKITLVNPRMAEITMGLIKNHSFLTSKNKKTSNN
ncbi:O-antigen ligase family protein [Fictibacillus nanhaiensis]|uniref:O-antigen ligase family protein n=1 Tax=Fictibacillus nanhaiensis TaxID=742169 RepID=UPI001C947E04|nr:O-antigen ligase family protein [Fictibacillus nanhaiensis]MBY6037168.1 O-antigen ligase family protein [Fictibacillus nanhaiensis]